MTMGSRSGQPTEEALTTFSALHFLRNYNQLLAPTGNNLISGYNPYALGSASIVEMDHVPRDNRLISEWPPILGAFQPYFPATTNPTLTETSKGRILLSSSQSSRRPRGEKRPIPEEQKDDRYYERRKRNNQAAKKSRDARKLREDQIALKAALLEHENAVLRAQILTLREETQSLRQLLFVNGKVADRASLSLVPRVDDYQTSEVTDFCDRTLNLEEKDL